MKFENEQVDMPEFLQFQFYKCKVTAWDHGQNDIEKRIADLFQCHNCASAECRPGHCKEFGLMMDAYMEGNGDNWQSAKRKINHFCVNCGESGGHYGQSCPNKMKCKFCGSTEHNNWKSWKCPYWRLYGILTKLFNVYYKKNRKIDGIAMEMKGNMDYQWKADINWIFEPTQRDIMDPKRWKIVQLIHRDTDLLKWYLSKGLVCK